MLLGRFIVEEYSCSATTTPTACSSSSRNRIVAVAVAAASQEEEIHPYIQPACRTATAAGRLDHHPCFVVVVVRRLYISKGKAE